MCLSRHRTSTSTQKASIHQILHDAKSEVSQQRLFFGSGCCQVCVSARQKLTLGQEVVHAYCLPGWRLGNVPSKARGGAFLASPLPAHFGEQE